MLRRINLHFRNKCENCIILVRTVPRWAPDTVMLWAWEQALKYSFISRVTGSYCSVSTFCPIINALHVSYSKLGKNWCRKTEERSRWFSGLMKRCFSKYMLFSSVLPVLNSFDWLNFLAQIEKARSQDTLHGCVKYTSFKNNNMSARLCPSCYWS